MTYIIAEPCIGEKDASCVAVCPVDCIYEAENQYFIHPDECIDCGACRARMPGDGDLPRHRGACRMDVVHRKQLAALRLIRFAHLLWSTPKFG